MSGVVGGAHSVTLSVTLVFQVLTASERTRGGKITCHASGSMGKEDLRENQV